MWNPNGKNIAPAAVCCALLLAEGCSQRADDGPGFPVAGKVTVDGEPLAFGAVLYIPDSERGNHSPIRPAGPIDAKGTYTLSAEGKRNIPAGHYIVVVQAFEPRSKNGNRSMLIRGRSLIDPAYGAPATSGLKAAVKGDAGPADYDLHLKR